MNIAAKGFAVESQQHEFCSVVITQRGRRYENVRLFLCCILIVVGLSLELNGCIHLGPEVRVWLQNLNFDLNGRFLPIRFGRHFGNFAFVRAVFECIESDDAFLLGRQFGKVILGDIEFDLNVVEISERDYRSAWTAFGAAGELCGDLSVTDAGVKVEALRLKRTAHSSPTIYQLALSWRSEHGRARN